MKQYLNLIKKIITKGTCNTNRTGTKSISIPGAMMQFDLQKEFPVVTTKKFAFKVAVGELIGFLRASNNAKDFRKLNCKIWDANANKNKEWLSNPYRNGTDDLGSIYGVQWRMWPAYKVINYSNLSQIIDAQINGFTKITEFLDIHGIKKLIFYKPIDQLRNCLDKIIKNPSDRRILFHSWNPALLDQISLPACHLLYQFLPNNMNKEISLCLYIRSNDIGLGAPFNLVEGAILLHLVARLTGYIPKWFTYFIGDAHIYKNHISVLSKQIKRIPYASPNLIISNRVPKYIETKIYEPQWLDQVDLEDFSLENYSYHPELYLKMSI